jgi:tRNA threonylcarbamoyl adenosine modification protein YeaZ
MKAAPKAPRAAAPPRLPARFPAPHSPILLLDTGSPLSSLALGGAGECYGHRSFPLRRTAEELLPQLRGLLKEAGLSFADLGGVVALRGPGSFTGLRIGLATALGFHQALGLPATAVGTLPVLASWAIGEEDSQVTVAVDALRGDFFAQVFLRGDGEELVPLAEPRLYGAEDLLRSPGRLAGFGLRPLLEKAGGEIPEGKLAPEPPALAEQAIPLLPRLDWDPGHLIQPIYFRPPAVTAPKA